MKTIFKVLIGLAVAGAAIGSYLIFKPKKTVNLNPDGSIGDGSGTGTTPPPTTPPGTTPPPTTPPPNVQDPRITTILDYLNKQGKFETTANALYLIKNLDSVGEDVRPTTASIKLALKHSNMAYYDGKVEPRWTVAQAEVAMLAPFANKSSLGAYTFYFGSGFSDPNLANWTPYNLKKMLAHGYWFALILGSDANVTNSYANYKSDGRLNGFLTSKGSYIVKIADLLSPNPTILTNIVIPDIYKGGDGDYYLQFTGKRGRKAGKTKGQATII